MPMNKMRVEVCGASYVINTEDDEDYVLSLAEQLHKNMSALLVETPSASVTAAAVITAMSYLDEARKNAQSVDNMRTQIREYLEESAGAKVAADEAYREIERLRREIGYLKEKRG